MDVVTDVIHVVKARDMPPIPQDQGESPYPGDATCGAAFFWVTDEVTLPANSAYFRGVLVFAKGIAPNCMLCLGTVDE